LGKRKYAKWFGIGIKIEAPNLPQGFFARLARWAGGSTDPVKIERKSWFAPAALCRRWKSRVAGVVSGKIQLTFKQMATPSTPATTTADVHVMPSGPLADGCPSVDWQAARRGAVSQAPPMWLLKAQGEMAADCKGFCVRARPQDDVTASVDLTVLGTMTEAAGELPRAYVATKARNARVRRKVWVGAFFDHDLRLGCRYPLPGCAFRRSEIVWEGKRADLRGAFVRSEEALERQRAAKKAGKKAEAFGESQAKHDTFEGVFVSVGGPVHASNLLLPAPMFRDFLNCRKRVRDVISRLAPCNTPEFVPAPERQSAR
jgi:hypothetical protein